MAYWHKNEETGKWEFDPSHLVAGLVCLAPIIYVLIKHWTK